VWARAWGGAATVREHDAHGRSLRRGLEWSQTSTPFSDRKLPMTLAAATGRRSSHSCVFWSRRKMVYLVARPWGEAQREGAWRERRSPVSLVFNGGDLGALSTGWCRGNPGNGRQGERRCTRGDLIDMVGRLGVLW